MGQVHDLDRHVLLLGAHPQLELAARAKRQHLVGAGLDGFVETCLADLGGHRWLLDQREHRAAAVSVLAVVAHLDELDAGYRFDQVTRRLVDA